MIFKSLDFHAGRDYRQAAALVRSFRLRINYIVDSFSMRIPKKIRTLLFHKLNVCVNPKRSHRDPFFTLEGIGRVEIVDPKIHSIYRATPAEARKAVKAFLRRGIRIAAKNDRLFAQHLQLWDQLLSSVDEEFDYDFRISRSH